jgi:2-enoate reductase
LYEKTGELGGVFIAAAAPCFKEKDKLLIEWYKKQLADLNIDIRLNTAATPEQLKGYDEVILATGAKPRKLPVPGTDGEGVIEAVEYLRGYKDAGQTAVIIGGGLTGCEIAYEMALKGKKAVIVEMQDDILKVDGLSAANSNFLREAIRYYGIGVYLENTLVKVEKDGDGVKVAIKDKEGKETLLKADSVILSVGYVPDTSLTGLMPDAHIIGDAKQVGNLKNVIFNAYDTAYAI